MTKYEELRRRAEETERKFNQRRERCWGYLAALMNGFVTFCAIPEDRLLFMRWNKVEGEGRRYQPPDDGRYNLVGATELDRADGYWHLGLLITVSEPGRFPEQWFGFVLCVSEDRDGTPLVKLGVAGKPRRLDLGDADQCEEFYRSVFDMAKQMLSGKGDQRIQKEWGFSVSAPELAGPGEGEQS
jgi:hypothetical protein